MAAAVELHTTMSLCREQPVKVVLTPDSSGERNQLPGPAALSGKLILADRGYLDLLYCMQVGQAGGAFAIRGKNSLNPIIRKCLVGGVELPDLVGDNLNVRLHLLRGKHADIEAEWKKRGKTLSLRLVLYWDPRLKLHMYLVTNLARTAFDENAVRALYRLRWQVELLFKEWKSYANLHRFQTEKASIVEGLIWLSLAAATVKRFFAQATQLVREVDVSTRIAAMAQLRHISAVIAALFRHADITAPVTALLAFLATNARRAHHNRDQKTGRTQFGIQSVNHLC